MKGPCARTLSVHTTRKIALIFLKMFAGLHVWPFIAASINAVKILERQLDRSVGDAGRDRRAREDTPAKTSSDKKPSTWSER